MKVRVRPEKMYKKYICSYVSNKALFKTRIRTAIEFFPVNVSKCARVFHSDENIFAETDVCMLRSNKVFDLLSSYTWEVTKIQCWSVRNFLPVPSSLRASSSVKTIFAYFDTKYKYAGKLCRIGFGLVTSNFANL